MADEVKLSTGGDSGTPVKQLDVAKGEKLEALDDDAFAAALGLADEPVKTQDQITDQVIEEVKGEQKPKRQPPKRKIDEIKERMEDAKTPIDQYHKEEVVEEPPVEVAAEAVKTEEIKEEEKKEELPPLLTEFSVFDGQGELEIPRDLKFSFKANKKDYKDIPLDKVVLLAQMGVYNEERQQEVEAARYFVAEAQRKEATYNEMIQKVKNEVDALFDDEDYYLSAREEYRKMNSPEARARRAEDEARKVKESVREAETRNLATQYFATQIFPTVERILKETSVSEDEILGRFNRLIAPEMVNGVVPYHRLPAVKQLVETELAQWARSIVLDRQKKEKVTEAKVQAEKVKTALAKRQVAQTLNTGAAATQKTTIREPKKPKRYASADDFLKDIDNVARAALEEEMGAAQ